MYLKNCNTCSYNGKLNRGCNGNCVELDGINTWSDWKPKKTNGSSIIISAFPACGKSTAYRNQKHISIVDSDSSEFSWIKDKNGINTKERNPNFPNNYIEHIKSKIGIVDIIMVSSHEVVRKAMSENGLKFFIVYPNIELKDEWVRRFVERGSDEKFISFIESNWDKFITDLDNEVCEQRFIFGKNDVINGDNLKEYFDESMGNLSYAFLNSNIHNNKYQ